MNLPIAATKQFALNVVVRVRPEALPSLRTVLAEIAQETVRSMQGRVAHEAVAVPFAKVVSLHYARWVILEASAAQGTGPKLALSTNFDGPVGKADPHPDRARDEHLRELIQHCRKGIDRVYAACDGYPGPPATTEQVLRYFVLPEHVYPTAAFYCGSRGRSRDQIIEEAALRRRVESFVDQKSPFGLTDPEAIRAEIKRALEAELGAIPPFPPQPDLRLRGIAILALAVLPVLPLALLLLPYLLLRESLDAVDDPDRSDAERRRILEVSRIENIFLQNQLTHVVEVKPGLFRSVLLSAVLATINLLAETFFNKGKLGDIPSIHFARWLRIDDGKRLLFFSNFDGSWESYLGDFVDQASSGLTAVWSNTVGYPRTRLLVRAGSRDEANFKAWTRKHQIATAVWFSAYQGLSIVNVNDNTEIRRGLSDPSAMPATAWLAKLG